MLSPRDVALYLALAWVAWQITRSSLEEAREDAISTGGVLGVLGRTAFGGEEAGASSAPTNPALVALGKPHNALGVVGRITEPQDGGNVSHALFSGIYHVRAVIGNVGTKRVVGDARLFIVEPHLLEGDVQVGSSEPNVVLEPGAARALEFAVPLSSLLFSVFTRPLEARLEFAGYQLGSSRFTVA